MRNGKYFKIKPIASSRLPVGGVGLKACKAKSLSFSMKV